MRFAGKLVLAVLLIALVVFGLTQLVMVHFSVESRYSEKFSISPIIGNLFLIKTGLWTKVRQVTFILTPEKQGLLLNYSGPEKSLISSMSVGQTGAITVILANYDQGKLSQLLSEKDRISQDLLTYLCVTIKNTSDIQTCGTQVQQFIDWKNKFGLGEFVGKARQWSLGLVGVVYAGCTGDIQCGDLGIWCTCTDHNSSCPAGSADGKACGNGVCTNCTYMCNGDSGTLHCSGLDNQNVCESANPMDCGVGTCILNEYPCSWSSGCTPASQNLGCNHPGGGCTDQYFVWHKYADCSEDYVCEGSCGPGPTPPTITPPPGSPPVCTSWTSFQINNCTMAEWNAVPRGVNCITNAAGVTLHLSSNADTMGFADTDVANTCANLADASFSAPEAYATSKSWTLPGGAGGKKVCVRLSNAFGSAKCGGSIEYVPHPTCTSWTSFQINNCTMAEWNAVPRGVNCITNAAGVTLHLSSNADTMGFADTDVANTCANLADASFSAPEAYATSKSWTLPGGAGGKKVCVRFSNVGGSAKCGGEIEYVIPPTPPALPSCTSAGPPGTPTVPYDISSYNLFAYGVANTSAVTAYVWSEVNHQADMKTFSATNMGGGTWEATANMNLFSPTGKYYADLYLGAVNDFTHICGGAPFIVATPTPPSTPPPTPAPPDCTGVDVGPPGNPTIPYSQPTYDVYATGVTDATEVLFPTWSAANGQDDLVWYSGTNLGGDTWGATIPFADHPDDGQFYVHVYLRNSAGQIICGTAPFIRAPAVGTIQARAVSVNPGNDSCNTIRNGGTGGITGSIFSLSGGVAPYPAPANSPQSDGSYVVFNNATASDTEPYIINPQATAGYTLSRYCSSEAPPNSETNTGYLSSGETLTWDIGYTLGMAWSQAQGGDVYASGMLQSFVPMGALPQRAFILDGAGGYPGIATYGTDYNFDSSGVTKGRAWVSRAGANWLANEPGIAATDYYQLMYSQFGSPTAEIALDKNSLTKPASGVYYLRGPVQTSSATPWNVNAGESIVIFVDNSAGLTDASLTINNTINIASGGFVSFIVNGNITVDPSVAALQGIYITSPAGTFATGTGAVRFTGTGTFVAGNFTLGRSLAGAGNTTTPAELFMYNPQLLITMPEDMKKLSVSWQEVAP